MRALGLVVLGVVLPAGCVREPQSPPNRSAAERSARRAYDGAPPVIPHPPLGSACIVCHGDQTVALPGLGLPPPMPHQRTPGIGCRSNCLQCHVFRQTDGLFRKSDFAGLPQVVDPAQRPYPGAPPVMPHPHFLREDCLACHSGPAAREEIRCTHPERTRCLQCHAPRITAAQF